MTLAAYKPASGVDHCARHTTDEAASKGSNVTVLQSAKRIHPCLRETLPSDTTAYHQSQKSNQGEATLNIKAESTYRCLTRIRGIALQLHFRVRIV